MNKTLVLLSIFFFLFNTFSCITEENGVLVLTDKNFDEELQKHEHLIVEFYAPWCGHCKQLEPEYAAAAEILKAQSPPLFLAKVDSIANPNLTKKYEVEGFPTIKFYSQGEWSDYTGGRTKNEIVQWYNKKLLHASALLNSTEAVENLKSSDQVSIILFGDENLEKSSEFQTFLKVAKKFEFLDFFHVAGSEIANHFSAKPLQILLFKNFDEKSNKFTGQFTEERLFNFFSFYSIPLITKFDDRVAEIIFEGNKVALFYVRSEENADQELDEIFLKLAPEHREKIIFVTTDIVGEIEENLAQYMNLQASDLPHLRLIDVKGEEDVRNYVYTDKRITEEGVIKFLEDFNKGTLEVYLKSEELPKEQNHPVYKLVGKSFKEMVLDSDKNVLVEFYAPWCQHCQELEPIYTKLAEHFARNENLLIAKIDATANDVEGQVISGFPSIKFYPVGKKEFPVDYVGSREFDDLVNFVDGLLSPGETRERVSSDFSGEANKNEL